MQDSLFRTEVTFNDGLLSSVCAPEQTKTTAEQTPPRAMIINFLLHPPKTPKAITVSIANKQVRGCLKEKRWASWKQAAVQAAPPAFPSFLFKSAPPLPVLSYFHCRRPGLLGAKWSSYLSSHRTLTITHTHTSCPKRWILSTSPTNFEKQERGENNIRSK